MNEELITMSPDNAVDMALSMYIGYTCTVCGHKFNSVEDIKNRDPKCSGKDETGIKLACKECFANGGLDE